MKLSSSLRAFVYGMTVYRLVDEGRCKTLCLEDLTHGTDPISNLKIRCVGGRPLPSDGQPNYYRNTVGYFYLYKDSEYGYVNGKPQLLDMGDGRVLPLVMGGAGGIIANILPISDSAKFDLAVRIDRYVWRRDNISRASIMKRYSGVLPKYPNISIKDYLFFYCVPLISPPVLRFRFAKIDPRRLEEDENHQGIAYKTRQIVEPWRIGLPGTCIVGINSDWWNRAKNNPKKTFTGAVELGVACAIAQLGKTRFPKKIPWIVAGAILA